jgi:PAS domain S-box-containing protein
VNTRGSPLPARYDTSPLWRTRFSLSNLSIKQRLPLLIGTLLVGIITVSIWTSYRGVKESALEVGRERLSSLTQQLANQSQQSLPIVLNRTFTAGNDPAVRTFLKAPSAGSRTAATSVLQQFAPAQDPNSLQIELWNVAGSLALSVPEGSPPEPADLGTEFSQSGVDPFKVVGSIRIVNDVVVYTVTAAVKDDQGKPIGYLVRWRRASPTPNLRKQLSDLLGSEATLYYGNSKDDVWTDLEKAVPKPPVSLASTLEVTRYMRDGNAVMAMGRPIAGTPWFVLLEFPERAFLTHANKFLRLSLAIGVVLLMAGVAGAFALTRSITAPLRSLTEAAAAISGGDYSRMAAVRGHDELGELANAFNSMVAKVRETHRELERDLSERTARLEAAPSAMLMVDERGRITLVNAKLEQLFGYDREELLDQPVEMLVPDRYRIAHPEHRANFFRTPSTRAMGANRDLFGRRKDGSEIPIEIGLNPIRTDNGAFVLASIIDITERKRAEERFRLVVEASPSAMIMVNAEGRITLVNTQTEKLFGYLRAELLDQPVEMLVPERYRGAHPGHRAGFFQAPSSRAMGAGRDLYGRHKDGSEMPIEIGLNPINTDEGAFVLASIIDITERKRAEERFRQVIEGAPNGMVMVGREGKIALVNQQIEKSFGYGRDELLGQPIEMLVPERFRGHHLGYRNGFMAEPSTRSMGSGRDLYGLRKDGSEFPVEIGLNPLETEQGPMVLGTIVDITERKRAEAALRESEDQFRTMANSIPQLAWMAHADGFIFWYNQRWHDYTGKTPEQMEGWGWQSVHDPEVLPKVLEGWREAIANGQPFEMEFPLLAADGTFRMFLTRVQPMKDARGRVVQWFGTNTDVEELKRMERSLRDTQTRLNSTLSAGSIGTWTWDIVNDCLAADEFTAGMFSIETEAAAKGLPADAYLRAIIDEDRPGVASALEQAIKSCGNYDIEYRVEQKDGTLRWLQARGRVDCDAAGNGVSFHGAVMDITERKASQEDLRRSQQQLAGVIGSAMDAIITVDHQQRIVLFNSAAERMFLFPAEDAIGQPLDRFMPERFRAAHKGHIQSFGETHVTKRSMGTLGPLYGLRADGEEFPLEASISQIESDSQKLYTVILRDTTERKRADEALKEQARILDLAPVVIRDLKGRILLWNTGAEQMYGWSSEEAVGRIAHDLKQTKFPRPLEEIKARLLAHGHWEGEVIHVRKDGQRIVVASQWVLHRDENDNPKAILEVNNDITERKQAEREIHRLNEELEQRVAERTAQLQAVNKELEAFSYSVSHDLRAPLRHIDGFSQALLEDYTDKLDDAGKSYLREVRGASQEMAQLIDDVLQLARVTRSEMRREVVNLSDLARTITAEFKKREPERKVILNLGGELTTRGDKRLLRIVLNNLLGNAWKFTAKRAEPQITFGGEQKNGENTYFIRDNGAGFDMAYVGKLFGAFQRLHTAGEFEGTGIGLATVQRIVYRHGGRVWAEGAVDEGATFYFTLPNSKEIGDEQQSDLTG